MSEAPATTLLPRTPIRSHAREALLVLQALPVVPPVLRAPLVQQGFVEMTALPAPRARQVPQVPEQRGLQAPRVPQAQRVQVQRVQQVLRVDLLVQQDPQVLRVDLLGLRETLERRVRLVPQVQPVQPVRVRQVQLESPVQQESRVLRADRLDPQVRRVGR